LHNRESEGNSDVRKVLEGNRERKPAAGRNGRKRGFKASSQKGAIKNGGQAGLGTTEELRGEAGMIGGPKIPPNNTRGTASCIVKQAGVTSLGSGGENVLRNGGEQ